MKYLTVEQVVFFNKSVNEAENAGYSLVNRGALESAMASAFYFQVDNGFMHGAMPEIAAALCYKIAKSHPFMDGNKRTAAVAALVFLQMNDYNIEFEEYGDADTEFSRQIISFVENKTSLDDLKKWFMNKVSTK